MVISHSVGRNGRNLPGDVGIVQDLLNMRLSSLGYKKIAVDRKLGPSTISAIEAFQVRVMQLSHPDGRIDPSGKTLKALTGRTPRVKHQATGNLSGADWWHANEAKFRNSKSIDDLAPSFRTAATEFMAALQAAGATIDVSATLRHPTRAYLMHYAWDIKKGLVAPSAVPTKPGCNIAWVHETLAKSIYAAGQMVALFGIVYRPSLTSRHIEGLAIDMTITWTGTLSIKNKQGAVVKIDAPRSGASNTVLHAVGATYGVKKLLSDEPHWSSDGH